MKRGALIALAFLAMLSGAEAAEPLRLPPPQGVDPDAAELHLQLLRIIEAKDAEALSALADADVKLSFGGDYGRATMVEWAAEDWFWPEWRRITAYPPVLHGRGEGAFLAYPYIFIDWPDPLDPFGHVATGEGAVLRARPETNAPVAAEVEFAILQLRDDQRDAPDGWAWLCIQGGDCGYAEKSDFASPIDWRAIFIFEDGNWRMTAFIAGD